MSDKRTLTVEYPLPTHQRASYWLANPADTTSTPLFAGMDAALCPSATRQ
jgi:hypothetical protein